MVSVRCRKCGESTESDNLVLDSVYKMMICPNCVNKRKAEERNSPKDNSVKNSPVKEKQEEKPPGWDKEDEYLEKMYQQKRGNSVKVKKIDSQTVKYICPKCKYAFVYNTVLKKPARCPYCSDDIRNISF